MASAAPSRAPLPHCCPQNSRPTPLPKRAARPVLAVLAVMAAFAVALAAFKADGRVLGRAGGRRHCVAPASAAGPPPLPGAHGERGHSRRGRSARSSTVKTSSWSAAADRWDERGSLGMARSDAVERLASSMVPELGLAGMTHGAPRLARSEPRRAAKGGDRAFVARRYLKQVGTMPRRSASTRCCAGRHRRRGRRALQTPKSHSHPRVTRRHRLLASPWRSSRAGVHGAHRRRDHRRYTERSWQLDRRASAPAI
jgi:hypothetical protein